MRGAWRIIGSGLGLAAAGLIAAIALYAWDFFRQPHEPPWREAAAELVRIGNCQEAENLVLAMGMGAGIADGFAVATAYFESPPCGGPPKPRHAASARDSIDVTRRALAISRHSAFERPDWLRWETFDASRSEPRQYVHLITYGSWLRLDCDVRFRPWRPDYDFAWRYVADTGFIAYTQGARVERMLESCIVRTSRFAGQLAAGTYGKAGHPYVEEFRRIEQERTSTKRLFDTLNRKKNREDAPLRDVNR